MTPGGANTYSIALPESTGPVLVARCQTALGHQYGATLLAVRADGQLLVNPGWHTELPPGAVLYYVAPRRLTVREITRALHGEADGT